MHQEFVDAVGAATPAPHLAKISQELWMSLKDAGLIKLRDVGVLGILSLGSMWFYKDTMLVLDPELESGKECFKLPSA